MKKKNSNIGNVIYINNNNNKKNIKIQFLSFHWSLRESTMSTCNWNNKKNEYKILLRGTTNINKGKLNIATSHPTLANRVILQAGHITSRLSDVSGFCDVTSLN